MEILNEIDVKHQELLDSSKIIKEQLSNSEKLEKKSERLRKLGFSNSYEVTQIRGAIKEAKKNLVLIQTVEKYAIEYPNQKFITKNMMIDICNKYDLKHGPVEGYIGPVPEKNLKEIEKFKVKEEDISILRKDSWATTGWAKSRKAKWTPEQRTALFKGKIVKAGPYNDQYKISHGFIIMAPKELWSSRYDVKGNAIIERKPVVDRDPIVLKEVADGYLIITAWGPEASDELVVNPKQN